MAALPFKPLLAASCSTCDSPLSWAQANCCVLLNANWTTVSAVINNPATCSLIVHQPCEIDLFHQWLPASHPARAALKNEWPWAFWEGRNARVYLTYNHRKEEELNSKRLCKTIVEAKITSESKLLLPQHYNTSHTWLLEQAVIIYLYVLGADIVTPPEIRYQAPRAMEQSVDCKRNWPESFKPGSSVAGFQDYVKYRQIIY